MGRRFAALMIMRASKKALHMVSAWAVENVCLCSPKPTSALKTACIGCLMSLFVKMNHA